MLNALRKGASSWVAKLLLGILVISFGIWGIADVFRGTASTTVVTAGETEVPIQDYAFAYQRAQTALSQQMGRRLTREEAEGFGVDQQVLSQLIADAVLDEQARRLGLGLSESRLGSLIAEDPSFHDQTGGFSRQAFRQVLSSVGLSEESYVRNRENAAVRGQIVEAVADGAMLPQTVETAVGLYIGERRTVDYLVLPPSLVQPVANPDDAALQAYFNEKKAAYKAPEYRGLAYAELTPSTIADPQAVSEDQVKEDYERNAQRFTTPEKRRIEQVVFPDKDAADAARAEIDGGTSFEDVVKETGRSIEDADLGLLARGDVPDQAIAEAAFSLDQGAVSDVVDGMFGPALVRVTEIEPQAVRPLAEVEPQIRQELALESATDAVFAAYDTYEDARASGATFEEATQKAGIPTQSVAAIDRTGRTPDGEALDLPGKDDLLAAVFDSEPGLDNPPINMQAESGYVFYDVKSIDPARDRTLDEVKDQVVTDWKADETQRLLDEKAKAYLERLQNGEDLAAIAADADLQPASADAVTRQTAVSQLGQAGATAAFSGGVGTAAQAPAPNDSRILIKVKQVAPPADPQSNVSEQQRQQLATTMENDLFQSYIALLQGEYPVRVYPRAVEQAQGMLR
ncbi:peptidylprolyl isomerase [Consotaella aegiceratis]|uniref:peptidylprolyl isomerase n=1 Tax=Consotaella aegiceratis TaxID=3097961 RepID=UPI002F40CA78